MKTFTQECSNDDLGLTSSIFMARTNMLSGLLDGKSSWPL